MLLPTLPLNAVVELRYFVFYFLISAAFGAVLSNMRAAVQHMQARTMIFALGVTYFQAKRTYLLILRGKMWKYCGKHLASRDINSEQASCQRPRPRGRYNATFKTRLTSRT
ncbi:hypothetical protein I7I48_08788 [Histoplasma ohiense]|nr:hypothetical protein I7I48_08788 [Histoplasma ohiense (nom. inval.)]